MSMVSVAEDFICREVLVNQVAHQTGFWLAMFYSENGRWQAAMFSLVLVLPDVILKSSEGN